MLYMEMHVPSLLPEKETVAGNLLRKLLVAVWSFPSMSEDVVRKVLFFEKQNGLPNQGGMLQRIRKRTQGKNTNKLGEKSQK